MKNFLSLPPNESIESIAIGKFDGMHLAHIELLKNLCKNGAIICISDFKRHSLTPNNKKMLYTKYPMFAINLSKIKQQSGAEFVALLRQKLPNLQKIVVGYDFAFGKDRECVASDLAKMFPQTIIIPECKISNIGVHSSLIREFITLGDMPMANMLLGRLYSISGSVISGQNIGSKMLYPTININAKGFVMSQNGVYASFTKIDSKIYKSVSFVGLRLSTDRHFSIESHILDLNLVLAHKHIEIYFAKKLRDNQKFDDLAMLKKQISNDINNAREILKECKSKII